MRRLALITSLLLGAATLAQADPQPQRWPDRTGTWNDRGHTDRDRHNDRGYQGRRIDRRDRRQGYDQWRMLAVDLRADARKQSISMPGERLRRLRIEANRGQPVILKIFVEGMNGRFQTFEPRQTLSMRNGSSVMDLDLGNGLGGVRRIIVYTQGDPYAQFSVLAY